jgi:hypothetical protein
MKVVVRFHTTTYDAIFAWRQTRGTTEEERAIQHELVVDHLRVVFGRHLGFPPDAVKDEASPYGVYTWQATNQLEIRFIVHDRPSAPRRWWDIGRWVIRLVRPVVRKVIIVGWVPQLRP